MSNRRWTTPPSTELSPLGEEASLGPPPVKKSTSDSLSQLRDLDSEENGGKSCKFGEILIAHFRYFLKRSE